MLQDKVAPKGFIADFENSTGDFRRILSIKNLPAIGKVVSKMFTTRTLDVRCCRFDLGMLEC
jgi:hypothetical protein